jgi:hypothetical protein
MVLHFSFLFFCGGGSSGGVSVCFVLLFFRSFRLLVFVVLVCLGLWRVRLRRLSFLLLLVCGAVSVVALLAWMLLLVFGFSGFSGVFFWSWALGFCRSVCCFCPGVGCFASSCFACFPFWRLSFGLVPSRFLLVVFVAWVWFWASCAFAVGLGVPVVVFGVSRSCLPSWAGSWVPVSVASVGFCFCSFAGAFV